MSETSPTTVPSVRSDGVKRRRTSGTYERRRAVAACKPCRQRKTKCDNQRPVCGFCQLNRGDCVYPDRAKDYSTYDPASIAILDRINHVVSLLEANPNSVAPAHVPPVGGHVHDITQANAADIEIDHALLLELPDFLATSTNCEGVLTWPIFSDDFSGTPSFVLEANDIESGQEDFSRREIQGSLGKGVQEDDFIPLSRRFLTYVHVKNPILDVASFKTIVRDAAENGTRWDGPSCLVLIACALACLASPFAPGPSSFDSPESVRSISSLSTDIDTAMSYYLAARKRLGLLRPSLIHVQCLFLCGVFEMYTLNPMQAWFYMHQASVQFQNLMWARNRGPAMIAPPLSQEVRRLEQRLYWSCMKSECELRGEIPLPPSGIIRFDYPDLFPSPPTELASPANAALQSSAWGSEDIEPEEERSWFYYLAEISFRRLLNRAIIATSRNGFQSWLDDFEANLEVFHNLDEQINVWCAHLPPQLKFDESATGNPNELVHYVRNRARGCREWIHRPFVYYLVHHPSSSSASSAPAPSPPAPDPRAYPLARQGLELCIELTLQSYSHHRHHGTWYVARTAMTRALLLLAAARSGRVVPMPERWVEAVDKSLATLQRWAPEAPDLRRAAEVLERIVASTYIGLQSRQACGSGELPVLVT